jgi:WD40 repeat protein
MGADFSHDGQYIVTGSHDGIARIWDAQTGALLQKFVHTATVNYAVFSHDDRYIATASWDGMAHLWDVSTGTEVRQFVGTGSYVNGVVFSSDDRYLLTGGTDNMVRVWDLATGELLRAFKTNNESGFVVGVSFSPDDQYVVAGSSNGGVYIWERDLQSTIEMVCSRLYRELSGYNRSFYGITDLEPICPSNPNLLVQETTLESVYAIGNFQRQVGCIDNFVPNCEQTRLSDEDGDGIYTLTIANFPQGEASYQAVLNGRTLEYYGVNGESNGILYGQPLNFDVAVPNSSVTFSYNATTHEIAVEVKAP